MNIFKKFDDLLTSRLILWGISLTIAIFMWFYVMDAGEAVNERRKFLCQLEFRNLEPQLSIRSAVKEVMVEIDAPEKILNNLKYDSIVSEVDLKGRSSGKYREAVRVTTPQSVVVASIIPSEIDIELIRQIGRVFPVELTLPQDIPAGRYLEAVEIVPKEVRVRGSEGDLAKIGSVNITPTVEELVAGKELLLPVKITQSQPFEDEVILEPQQIKMNATLVAGLPKKKVPVNVRLIGKPFMDYDVRSVTTDPAEIVLQGAQQKLDAISAVDTETVDITDIAADQTLVVPLRPFETVESGDVSAVGIKSVRLLIQLRPIVAQKQLSGVPIAVEGQGAEKNKWLVNPPVADVTLEASPSRIESVTPEGLGLRLFVDVSNIFLSKATLPVRSVMASEDFRIVRTNPSTVSVNVTE